MTKRFKKFFNEEGNSFLLFIFLMPVLCGAFGLGLDAALGQYTRSGIQDAADIATNAGANQTVYAGNRKIIDIHAASATAKAVYREKRQTYPNISGKPPKILDVTIISGRGVNDTLQLHVEESSPTVFLHLLKVDELNYKVNSQARLGYIVER